MNVGQHIGQYRILRKLGAGGMGTVFLGEHILLKRRAAIKTLLPSLSVHKEIVDRFFNEARATSAISDPGVVQIFDFGYHVDGTAYIVMEVLEGESLSDRIERLGKLPMGEALRVARQGACALAAAHDRGIIHRDLKPENVFLVRDAEAQGGERAKILDFGICKVEDVDGETKSLTQTGAMMGTPLYMSPEQCQGAGRVDHRSDIYALGCVLFHMLTGQIPFDGEGPGEIIAAHIKDEPPAPSSIIEMPELVDELVLKCLAKDPADRFQDMPELQRAIEQVLSRLSSPDEVATPAAPALMLKRGFRSVYDGNFGSSVPTKAPAKSTRATVSERRRRSTTLGDANGQAEQGPRKHNFRTAVAIFLVGLVGALFATSLALDGEDAEAGDATHIEAASPAPRPVPDLVVEPTPREPVVDAGVAATEPSVETPAAAPVAEPVVEPAEKPKRQPAVGKPRKSERRDVRRPAKQPSSNPEDLYDTR